jgi:hypothetical protein
VISVYILFYINIYPNLFNYSAFVADYSIVKRTDLNNPSIKFISDVTNSLYRVIAASEVQFATPARVAEIVIGLRV